MIGFEKNICVDFEASAAKEWLETNGIGGYASGTISGANTRRYHGLLTAATTPPTGRAVLLSKLEEKIVFNNQSYELSADQFPNAIHPQGFRFLTNFRLSPFPVWTYEIEKVRLEKTVFMPHGENTVIVEYKFVMADAADPIKFVVLPLLAFRSYHYLRSETSNFNENFETLPNQITLKPVADLPALNIFHENGEIGETGFWYRNFEYQIERERGFDFVENLFQPFSLEFTVSQSNTITIIASTEPTIKTAADYRRNELQRRADLISKAGFADEFRQNLVAAANQFIVARDNGASVIAGYHWFSDWGRDTMIALPGLTLAANRPEICRDVLLEYSQFISEGMLPNRFPDVGKQPEYNTVDATLWYFEAVRAYLVKTSDNDFVKDHLYQKLAEIINWHLRGTRFNIHVDTDGLLCAGDKNTQLTWMDAKSGNTVFTPRDGKPVEIQALWYNALRVMENLAEKFADAPGKTQYAAMAELAKISFTQNFWNKAEDCLYDCINGSRDGSVRPNQIFAVSLTHSMVSAENARKIIKKVEAELLTPYGLRTLSPRDPQYQGRYQGDGFKRDSAYHQGTVWAWLAGAFFTAYAKYFADEPDTAEKIKNWFAPYKEHLSASGLGSISEIFDGDAPHTPNGCIAQAWSVAEILRAASELNVE